MRTIRTLMAATALTGVATAAVQAETWDLPMAYPATNFHSVTAAEFGECVGAATAGAVSVVTHPNGSLFAGNDIKRAVQTGQAPIGERLISAHQNENPMFGLDSIPFLATSFEDHERLWAAAGPTIAEILDAQNLVYLYSVPWPPQGLYFKREINSVADMSGIRFRAYNTATARLAELTNMRPVQIEAAELSQALATGVAESFISSGATGYDSQVWESLTHFYEVDAWLPRNIIFANKQAWNALDEATQTAMRDCAAAAKASGLQRSIDYTNFTLDGLRAGGMIVQRAGDELMEGLREVGATMTEEWLQNAGDAGRAVVEAYHGSN
jgi:TRAP-type C4-dicarboxylate transport system substrate-binding protein